MKKLAIILALAFLPFSVAPRPAHALFTIASGIWEVEGVSGSDLNGCMWDAGSTGVDYSTAVRMNVDGVIITATNTSGTAAVTLTGYTVVPGDVGNVINVTGGINAVLGRARVTAVNTGTNVWSIDHVITTAAGSVTGIFGGPCQTLQAAATGYANNNKVFVKAESTYVITSSITLAISGSSFPRNAWEGYNTVRGDGALLGGPTIQMSASMSQPAVGINYTGRLISMRNFIIDCNNVATSTGLVINDGHEDYFDHIKTINCTGNGIAAGATGAAFNLSNSEVSGTTSAASAGINVGSGAGDTLFQNSVHDNSCPGIIGAGGVTDLFLDNLVTNNTGDGITLLDRATVVGNTIHGNTKNGINWGAAPDLVFSKNNLITNNGLCGQTFNGAATRAPALPYYDGNAYYENGGGNRCFMDDTTLQNAIGTYVNQYDVQLATASAGGVSPYQNASANNYQLNGALGGGGSLIHKGVPQGYPGNSGVAYPDFGAYQSPATPRASAQ